MEKERKRERENKERLKFSVSSTGVENSAAFLQCRDNTLAVDRGQDRGQWTAVLCDCWSDGKRGT